MDTPNEYIVYEPDQVLTNDDLNESFNYLDQQNRWTRNKLIGVGIACGLKLVQQTGAIQITEGCGVTSEGYLILLPADQTYAYYQPYTPLDQPQDLAFSPDGNWPFYKPAWQNKTIYSLLTDADYSALEPAQQASAQLLTALGASLANYAVVLFLEAAEADLKNCSNNDCNNKGEKMVFTLRVLLVSLKDLFPNSVNGQKPARAPEIRLKRYNVPYQDLGNSAAVLNAFLAIVDDATLTSVQNAVNFCYQTYQGVLPASASKPFPQAGYLASIRNAILNAKPWLIEYFYDYVNDLILAYYEFREKATQDLTACCYSETAFPLHLVLGQANVNTPATGLDPYRRYFIYAGLFDRGNAASETAFLFKRMQIMASSFSRAQMGDTVKITPGQYEYFPLSHRAIPYYYPESATNPDSLYQYWNFRRTADGNQAFNLGYHSYVYNSDPAVTDPLEYDIEKYIFFRIEGHIGQPYQRVLSNLLSQRANYNLPFDVVAVSAEMLRSGAALPPCRIEDLITDFRLLISELACRVHLPFCFFSQLPYTKDQLTIANLATNLAKYEAFKQQADGAAITLPFGSTTYVKGSFMQTFCPPATGTLGAEYLAVIQKQEKQLSAVLASESGNTLMTLIFDYFNVVEEMMLLVVPVPLARFDTATFAALYLRYKRILAALITAVEELFVQAKKTADPVLTGDLLGLIAGCADELLLVLWAEYERRVKLYLSQLNFLTYFRKHPGLEHKAGVPKGGTFVLVYHGEEAVTTTAGGAAAAAAAGTISLSDYDLIRDFVAQCSDAPADQQQNVLTVLTGYRPVVGQKGYDIPAGIVIADFYLPYLCCSDCAPVAYVLPQQKPSVSMAATDICQAAAPVPITTSPADTTGTVSVTGLPAASVTNTNGWMLDPTKVVFNGQDQLTGTLIYTVNGESSDPQPVTIYRNPSAAFTNKIIQPSPATAAGTGQLILTAQETDSGFGYSWTVVFDPQDTGLPAPDLTKNIVDAQFLKAVTATVTLQVTNGPCTTVSAPQVIQLNSVIQ